VQRDAEGKRIDYVKEPYPFSRCLRQVAYFQQLKNN
jgi:hypothetical protein